MAEQDEKWLNLVTKRLNWQHSYQVYMLLYIPLIYRIIFLLLFLLSVHPTPMKVCGKTIFSRDLNFSIHEIGTALRNSKTPKTKRLHL